MYMILNIIQTKKTFKHLRLIKKINVDDAKENI
jgi:hypothetical protein